MWRLCGRQQWGRRRLKPLSLHIHWWAECDKNQRRRATGTNNKSRCQFSLCSTRNGEIFVCVVCGFFFLWFVGSNCVKKMPPRDSKNIGNGETRGRECDVPPSLRPSVCLLLSIVPCEIAAIFKNRCSRASAGECETGWTDGLQRGPAKPPRNIFAFILRPDQR